MAVQAFEERLRQDRNFARRTVDEHLDRPVYSTVADLARKLTSSGIAYAVSGSLAVGKHPRHCTYRDLALLSLRRTAAISPLSIRHAPPESLVSATPA